MNIILIISDTFRYDNLFDRAAMPVRTPELDRFSRRAVSLERMYTGSFPTIPQRTDTTSGRFTWPWHPWQDRRLSTPNHMPEILREAGYVSQLICDCPHLFRAAMNEGFDGSYVTRGQEGDAHLIRMNHPIEEAVPSEKTRQGSRFPGRNLVDTAKWVNWNWYREEDRFGPPHGQEGHRVAGGELPARPLLPVGRLLRSPRAVGPAGVHGGQVRPRLPGRPDAPSQLRPVQRLHRGGAAQPAGPLRRGGADDGPLGRAHPPEDRRLGPVAQLHRSLHVGPRHQHRRARAHREVQHQREGPTPLAHLPGGRPCAVQGGCPRPGGRTLGAAAGTAAGHAAYPAGTWRGIEASPPAPFHGRSLAPILRGESDEPVRDFAITASYQRPGDPRQFAGNQTTPVLYTDRWAYAPIGAHNEPELYDLPSDPYAESDVAARHPDVTEELHAKLLAWLRSIDAPEEAIQIFQ